VLECGNIYKAVAIIREMSILASLWKLRAEGPAGHRLDSNRRGIMILTAQEEFGLRCALSLAREQLLPETHADKGSLTLTQIAEREGLTVPYAGKILRVLVQAGLVESTRGRSGGYRLERASSCITVAEVLHALGGKVYDGEICQKIPGEVGLCVHNTDCSVRSLLTGLQGVIDDYLSRNTLADLVTDERQMEQMVAFVQREMRNTSAGSCPS